MFSAFFIERPKFAMVVAIVLTLIGGMAIYTLPVNEYPAISPPSISIITVCGNADQACPTFPGQVNRYHWGFEDPAHATGTEEEILQEFRKIRDEIQLVFGAYVSGYRQAQS